MLQLYWKEVGLNGQSWNWITHEYSIILYSFINPYKMSKPKHFLAVHKSRKKKISQDIYWSISFFRTDHFSLICDVLHERILRNFIINNSTKCFTLSFIIVLICMFIQNYKYSGNLGTPQEVRCLGDFGGVPSFASSDRLCGCRRFGQGLFSSAGLLIHSTRPFPMFIFVLPGCSSTIQYVTSSLRSSQDHITMNCY